MAVEQIRTLPEHGHNGIAGAGCLQCTRGMRVADIAPCLDHRSGSRSLSTDAFATVAWTGIRARDRAGLSAINTVSLSAAARTRGRAGA
jgi:hypothetical protein